MAHQDLIHLDTHVVAWLYAGELERLTALGRQLLEERSVQISPFVVLELEYLFEIEKVSAPARTVLVSLEESVGLEVADVSLQELVTRALGEKWTRDPFDRLIVSHARLTSKQLLTRDTTISKHYSGALW